MLWIAVHLPLLSLESFAATLPLACDGTGLERQRSTVAEACVARGGAQAGAGVSRRKARAPTASPHGASEGAPPGTACRIQIDAGATSPGTVPASAPSPPIVLLAEHRVAVLNRAAREAGIQPGHRRATAMALAPNLVFGEADARRDAAALQAAAHAALAFTPSVTLRATEHVVLLEVQASLRYFGGLPRLLQRLTDALAPLGHALQCASAPSALGAALLARWRGGLEMGRHSTQPRALAALLDEVPVALLDSTQAHAEALQAMGLQRLGELRRLPRAGAARRFGAELLQALDRAYGEQPDPCEWMGLPPVFDSRLELFARADTTEQVLHGATRLLARLVAWAQAQHARVGGFELRMHHEPRHRDRLQPALSTLQVALAEPSADAAHLQLLLRERLAQATLAAPTLELSLHCDAAVPGAPPNAELFPTPGSEREGLLRLVERLQARLGREQVLQLRPRPDHRPERDGVLQPVDVSTLRQPKGHGGTASTARRPASGQAQERSRGSGRPGTRAPAVDMTVASRVAESIAPGRDGGGASAPASAALLRRLGVPLPPLPAAAGGDSAPEDDRHLPLSRPAWLLPQPELLIERDARPWLDGRPLQLLLGPERLETGWWDGEPAQRDYFVARAADGALVWVYRNRLPQLEADAPGGWYLHGRFA
jgi:protein ImuB